MELLALKRKRSKTKRNGTAPATGEQKKRCKRKVDPDVDCAGEPDCKD